LSGLAPPTSTVLRIPQAGRAYGALLTLEPLPAQAGLTARARPKARPEAHAANLTKATSYGRRVNKWPKWLYQLPTWRFALLVAGFDLTLLLVALGIEYLVTNGRVNLSFMAGYIPAMVIALTVAAVYNRRRESRRRPAIEQTHHQ
jgi:hypothetical protein